jgi:hypothetical protein
MKKLYFLDEQEKNRILNLHTEATKKQYLSNKKILSEALTWPKPAAWKALGKFFTKTVKTQGKTVAELLGDVKKYNQGIVKALDDTLVLYGDDFVRLSSGESGFMSEGGVFFNLDDISKYILSNFKPNQKPTPKQIQEFLANMPDKIKSKSGKIEDFKGYMASNIDDVVNDWVKYADASVTQQVSKQGGAALSTIKNYPKTSIGLGTSITALAAYKLLTIGTNSKQIAEAIRDTIGIFCNKYVLDGLLPETNIDGAKLYQKMIAAGDVYLGTDEQAIKTAIENIIRPAAICKMSVLFDQNPSPLWKDKIKKNDEYKTGHQFASFIYYEFTGIGELLSNLTYYVSGPLQSKLVAMEEQQKKADEERNKDDSKKDDKDKKTSTSNNNPQVTKTLLDGFIETFPQAKENIPCVIKKCKSLKQREGSLIKPSDGFCDIYGGNVGAIALPDGFVYWVTGSYLTFENAMANTKPRYKYKCDGDNIIKTEETTSI